MLQDTRSHKHLHQRNVHMQDHQRPTVPSTSTMPSSLTLRPLLPQRTKQTFYSNEFGGMNRPDIQSSPFSTYHQTSISPPFRVKHEARCTASHPIARLSNPFPSLIRSKWDPNSLLNAKNPQRFSYSQREITDDTTKQLDS